MSPSTRRRLRARGRPIAIALAIALALAGPWMAPAARASAAAREGGIEIVIDRAHSVLHARDVRTGEEGPELRVVVGSPGHPTPSGVFRAHEVVLSPGWEPGASARRAGAQPLPPSLRTPMGVAKIPFAAGGAVALHGGGESDLLGSPVSTGCVRASNAGMLLLVAWLRARDALGPPHERDAGDVLRAFRRPVTIAVR